MASITVKSRLDSKDYERGIDKIKDKTDKFGGGLGGIAGKLKAAFAVAAVAKFIQVVARAVAGLVSFGSELSDMSAQTGVSVETFQKLQRAVRDAGGQNQQLVNSLARIKDAQGEVLSGDKKMIESLAKLGINAEEFASMNVEDAFRAISVGLTNSGNAAKQFSAVADIIGQRNAPKLIEAMNAMAGSADELGNGLTIMSNRSAQTLDVVADRWANLKNNVKTGAAEIVASMFGWSSKIDAEVEKREKSAEKIAELERQSRLEAISEMRARAEEERLKAVEKIRAEEEKIAEKRRQEIKKIEDSVKIEIETDSIRRIGGMAGARVNDQLNIARRQVDLLEKLADYEASLPRIEENTKRRGLA